MPAQPDKLDIWNTLGKTDPDQTKGFTRSGGFRGTAIKPIYTTRKMTELFGPAGYGWGMGEPSFQTVASADGEVLVYCTVSLWWVGKDDAGRQTNTVWGVGGDKVVAKGRDGLRSDDEAFKKAFTDAVGNAMKHLGMSADVHMGLFDDSKYVSERRAEEAAASEPAAPPAPKPSKAKMRETWGEMRDELDRCTTVEDLAALWTGPTFRAEFAKMPEDWKEALIEHKDQRKVALTGGAEPTFREPA